MVAERSKPLCNGFIGTVIVGTVQSDECQLNNQVSRVVRITLCRVSRCIYVYSYIITCIPSRYGFRDCLEAARKKTAAVP